MKSVRKALFVFTSVSVLSSCMLGLDIFDDHQKATSSDLSEVQYANFYSYRVSGTDYLTNKIVSNFPYRKIGDIPFIQMEHVLGVFLKDDLRLSIQNNVYTYVLSNNLSYTVTVAVDASEGKITISDYDRYCSLIAGSEKTGNISTLAGMDSYVTYGQNEIYVYEEGGPLVLDLASYDLDVIAYGKTVYIPFAVASEVFFEPNGICFAYNGDDFYYPYSKALYKEDKTMSSYGKAFYGGSLSRKRKTSAFAVFNYNALCFSLDYFYGFRDKGFAPIDTYLKQHNSSVRTRLRSTDETSYQDGIDALLDGYLGDGHTGVYGYSGVYGDGKFETAAYSSRSYHLSQTGHTLASLRKNRLGESFSPVRFHNKTAFITFDSFDSAYKSFTKANVRNYVDHDTFAFLYKAFETIDNASGIENVVFDLSLNGGGAVDGLIASLGFLTNSVNINTYDPATKSKTRLYYSVDTNLDGAINENDIKPYRFYVLTSNFTFSSANLFATVCKTQGVATILGEKSGGGACVVRSSCTADGLPFQMSGNTRLSIVDSLGAWSDNDGGIAVDHYLNRSYYYNDSGLAQYVESL